MEKYIVIKHIPSEIHDGDTNYYGPYELEEALKLTARWAAKRDMVFDNECPSPRYVRGEDWIQVEPLIEE